MKTRWGSTTNQSKHLGSLRLSLLLALGLSPLACGGTVSHSREDGSGGRIIPRGDTGGAAGSVVVDPELGGGGSGGTVAEAGSGGTVVEAGSGGVVVEAGSGASAGDAGYSGSAGTGGTVFQCNSSDADPATNLANCENGLVHRPQAVTCMLNTASGGAAGVGGNTGTGGAAPNTCKSHADCSALPLGWCEINGPGGSGVCHAGCQQDGDCGDSAACQCDPSTPAGRCVYGSCRVDDDCGPNSVCAQVKQACAYPTFRCSDAGDECKTAADCPGQGAFCRPSANGNLVCSPSQCGRPFLVCEAPRVASVAPRTDWLEALPSPNLAGLSPTRRAELAAHWARLGQMEHASIAAFARFNLQLLSLGAPAELVEACNRALADETRHTKLCFALASHYGGTSVGPDRLDLDHCFEDLSLGAITKLVLEEGCIGETVAALEALEDADATTDPVVRHVLQGIAKDEQAHAELAFKFLRWALTQASREVRTAITIEAERSLADYERKAGSTRARAARHVVRPLLSELLQSPLNQATYCA